MSTATTSIGFHFNQTPCSSPIKIVTRDHIASLETQILDLKLNFESFDVEVDLQYHVFSPELWASFHNVFKDNGGYFLRDLYVFPTVEEGGIVRLKGFPTINNSGGRLSLASIESEGTEVDYDLSQQVDYNF